jgi:RHS repeat-associated protein
MTVIDANGRAVYLAECVYNSGSLEPISGTAYSYDSHGRLQIEQDISRPAAITAHAYALSAAGTYPFTETVTGPDGVVTTYEYDGFQRLDTTVIGVGGGINYPTKVHETVYNAANLPQKTYLCSCGTSATVFAYDAAGRVTHKYEKSPDDPEDDNAGTLDTHYEYPSATTRKTTLPSGATTIEATYLDGRPKSVTGTAQAPSYHDYGINGTGVLHTTYRAGSADRTNGWVEEQSDRLGRLKKRSTPAYGWSNDAKIVDATYTYDPAAGNLRKIVTTYRSNSTQLLPDQLFVYDAAGRLAAEGLDLDGSHDLAPDSTDRTTTHDRSFVSESGGWWSVVNTGTYAIANSGTWSRLSEARTRLTGFTGSTVAEVKNIDASGRTSIRTDTADTTAKKLTSVVTQSSVSATAGQITINGYDSETWTFAGEHVRKRYDNLGRVHYVDSRGDGTSFDATDTYHYHGGTSFVSSLEIAGVTTTYGYAWGGGKRTVSTTDAGGGTSHVVYNAMDLPELTYGSGSSPTQTIYDGLGRRQSLTTWRSTGFEGDTWPSSPGAGDTTTWTIEPATGLITAKTYPGGAHVDTTYTPLGQPKTRTLARTLPSNSTRVEATYAYYDGTLTNASDPNHRTQQLAAVSYNDGTPAVTYTYARSGLIAGVSDWTGARTFAYLPGSPLQLDTETLAGFYGSRIRKMNYDSGRPAGFQLGTSTTADATLAQTYDYTPTAGLVYHLSTSSNGGNARIFTYGYETGSSLIGQYATGSFTESYDYDPTSAARRSRVEGKWGSTSLARFDFGYDARGFLQSAKQRGAAFADYYSGMSYTSVYNFHTYDARGQLRATAMYRGAPPESDAPAPGNELPGRRFEYRHDPMGNRLTSGATGSAAGGDDVYVPNARNQYESRENNTVKVLGTAAATAKAGAQNVDDGGAATALVVNKKDRSFTADVLPLNNASGPAKGTVTVYAALTGEGPDDADLVGSEERDWQIAPRNQSFTYDADGNLTGDGVWSYQYDAENRLVRMETTTAAENAGLTHWVLEFKYDYMGRRVQKRTNNVTEDTDVYTGFAYDGWNAVAEFSVSSPTSATSHTWGTMLRSFTWGLDVAGSLDAAGGVGALVQIVDHANGRTYFPTYDGSGDVAALVDQADGALAAIYEYSPFGEPLRAEVKSSRTADQKAYVRQQPFRFSTKWTDAESGLVYYGYRYYSPSLGRFINRDPIEEAGGINLYAFVGNNPVSRWDVLGMDDDDDDPPWIPPRITTDTPKQKDPDWGNYVSSFGWTEYTLDFWAQTFKQHSTWIGSGSFTPPSVLPIPLRKKAPNKALPPCSQLRKQLADGTYHPSLTVESFIPGKTESRFHGDDRGFIDSPSNPADGTTSRVSVTSNYYPTLGGASGGTQIQATSVTYRNDPSWLAAAPSIVRTGTVSPQTVNVSYNNVVYMNVGYSSTNPFGPSGFMQMIGMDIRADVGVQIDLNTGMLTGSVNRSAFPANQVFFNGQSVYQGDASPKGARGLLDNASGKINGTQVCDPSK